MKNLHSVLQNVIGGSFSGIHTYYLQHLIQLVGYYSEDDLTDQERNGLNQINAVLLKYAELNNLISAIHYSIRDEKRTSPDIHALLEMRDAILQVDTYADVAPLLCYVKRKAVKAGDWPPENAESK